jgi:rhodanese-related sulfurtransferase
MTKIMPLADDVTVYPAHGAGSACGKNMMKETVDTLGNQKKMNYALNQPNKEAFIAAVTDGLLPPPAYFGYNVAMNKKGYDSFETVKARGLKPLSVEAFETLVEATGAMILDTRLAGDFCKGFIPQSVSIGVKGDFAPWVGALIGDVMQQIVLVTEPGMEEEVVTRLSRVGFDQVMGYLNGGFAAWQNAGKEIDTVDRITADEFAQRFEAGKSVVIDVRKETEYEAEHVEDAYSKPLAYINDWTKEIQPDQHFFMHCAGGYRSMIAASILQARGYRNFTEVGGGFGAISKTAIPTSDFVCQSKVMK